MNPKGMLTAGKRQRSGEYTENNNALLPAMPAWNPVVYLFNWQPIIAS